MSAIRMIAEAGGMPALGKAGPHGIPDLHLACFLRCAGHEPAGTRRDSRRWAFVHRGRPGWPRDVLAFRADGATVRPAGMMVRGG